MTYFVQNLRLLDWFISILPRMLRDGIGKSTRPSILYVLDTTPFTLIIVRACGRMVHVAVELLDFRMSDIRDKAGALVGLRLSYYDLAEVQRYITETPTFQQFLHRVQAKDRLPVILAKSTVCERFINHRSIWRALFSIEICRWQCRKTGESNGVSILFLEQRPWQEAIERYATKYNIQIVRLRRPLRIHERARDIIGPRNSAALRYQLSRFSFRLRQRGNDKIRKVPADGSVPQRKSAMHQSHRSGVKVAVQYYGHFNLENPERYSDLFFWQRSSLSARDVLVIFDMPRFRLDSAKWAEIRAIGMEAIALHPKATIIPEVPVYAPSWEWSRIVKGLQDARRSSLDSNWLIGQTSNYRELCHYWADFFRIHQVKVFVSWYKNETVHAIIADALQSEGGVTAIYQRSFESNSSPLTTAATDILFGFSKKGANIEQRSNSAISYYVVTGYLGDHRFPLLRANAQAIRNRLKQHGAKHIIAFFDENSLDDSKWSFGHETMREDYGFLLERVLCDPDLGLVLKPKAPRTLRRRLGPVIGLLDEAAATGRCFLYDDEGEGHSPTPPAGAALAADLAIHGTLWAVTAGLEAALVGIPTLLMDREGFPLSPLYKLGVGKVVFNDWQSLWDAVQDHLCKPNCISGFGDWSARLDEFDPFRDGRAAERMGTYLQWLIEGFKDGRSRETIMEDAAERYCQAWGPDKVIEIKPALSRAIGETA